MRKFLVGLCTSALVAATAFAGVAPAAAQSRMQYEANPQNFGSGFRQGRQFRGERGQFRQDRRGNRAERRLDRRDFRREARRDFRQDRRDYRRGFYRQGGQGFYNGHRGYTYRRPGYRNYNGFWFPLGAFAAGAVIGGAIASPQPIYRGGGSAHVQWCYDRWRSYREYDNSYQPYNGPRRICYSPYS